MRRKIERNRSAERSITVQLFGWPQEVRRLSVVTEYWSVRLLINKGNVDRVCTVYETDDYEKAFHKWEEYCRLLD